MRAKAEIIVRGPRVNEVAELAAAFQTVRRQTEALCEPLEIEDYVIQSMPDASPVKWHLAHTTWFFETFVLAPSLPGFRPHDSRYRFLFNSYYDAVGPRWSRPERGLLSRPTVAETYRYRAHVDNEMKQIWPLAECDAQLAATVELGIHHEQQHQELLLTDLKHAWAANPLEPVYRAPRSTPLDPRSTPHGWLTFAEGVRWIGHDGDGFAFDNEGPRHRVFLHGFRLARRLVTNRDYLEFMNDGGYDRPELWLSAGWAVRQTQGWNAPLYWRFQDGAWSVATLAGHQPVDVHEPVCHISYYEADAYARWAGARLPTEAEWETAAAEVGLEGNFLEAARFHPSAHTASGDRGPVYQIFGDVWQWTKSPYTGYPGYETPAGALGEYNGKFMCNQMVLRGASCVTPRSHARRTYRNFFPPEARWQFSGVRLAKDNP